jgi:hypothetical protein
MISILEAKDQNTARMDKAQQWTKQQGKELEIWHQLVYIATCLKIIE